MADTSHMKGGRVGPFQIDRRYRNNDQDDLGTDLGKIYEAHNVQTGAPALVVVADPVVGWEPEEPWQVRAYTHSTPAYVAVEVEYAPASGRLTNMAEMLNLLTCAVERLEHREEARAHLTRGPMGRLKRWAGRWRRLLRASQRGLAVAAFAVLGLGLAFWLGPRGDPRGPQDERHAAQGMDGDTAPRNATTLVQTNGPSPSDITYPLPAKPFGNQAKAPCKPKKGEVEINGGCWVELAKRPPCFDDQAEYQGKCYLPVAERSPPEPTSIQP
ncbi:hypothetical protein JQX13_28225 [Archangium violaceum]|uniref:hypothetical protein n=1 Tax=Archangium violaceum TaxID=83451 RepID=UPI00193B9CD8|nr:hypothetical protein [Archangium violaceum]QRK04157.1 hypothetical protein JQX13_28225 [Archangium violaceum]